MMSSLDIVRYAAALVLLGFGLLLWLVISAAIYSALTGERINRNDREKD